jgi:hypothetical protein
MIWGRQLGGFTMAKVTKKTQTPNPDVDQLTPSIKESHKMKTSCQSSSRGGGEVPKATKKVKRSLQKSLRKNTPELPFL